MAAQKGQKAAVAASVVDPTVKWRFIVQAVLYGLLVVAAAVAVLVLLYDPASAASGMTKAATALGFGSGTVIGSVPTFIEAVQKGIEACR